MVPLVMANIIDRGIADRDMGYIGKMGLCLIGLGVIGLVSAITAQFFSARASALDYATDAKLRAALKLIDGDTTTFIVSQRASSIMYADQIIVLDDGEIVGLGNHESLLQDCTVYQEIYYSQYPKKGGSRS